jgi:hypothetical protein
MTTNFFHVPSDTQANILGAFGASLTPDEIHAITAEPKPPEPPDPATLPDYHLSPADLRRQIAVILRAAAILQRNLRLLEGAKLPLVGVSEADCPDGSEAVRSFALSVQEGVNEAYRRRYGPTEWRAVGDRFLACVTEEQYIASQRFAIKAGLDLRDEDAGGVPSALSADVPAELVKEATSQSACAAECSGNRKSSKGAEHKNGSRKRGKREYIPTQKQIEAMKAKIRAGQGGKEAA